MRNFRGPYFCAAGRILIVGQRSQFRSPSRGRATASSKRPVKRSGALRGLKRELSGSRLSRRLGFHALFPGTNTACMAASRMASKPCVRSRPSVKARSIVHIQGLLRSRSVLNSAIRPTIYSPATIRIARDFPSAVAVDRSRPGVLTPFERSPSVSRSRAAASSTDVHRSSFLPPCNITGEEWVYASVAGRSSPVSTRNRPGLPRASLMPIRCRMAFARLPKKLGGWRSS